LLKRRRGFTLIELLVVIAIIGVLAAIAIPNFLVSVHRAKQKSTMKEIVSISTAIADYVTDNGATPTQDGRYGGSTDFYKALSPFYVKVLPINDKWGNDFQVWTGSDVDGNYGIYSAVESDFLVSSYGRDNKKDNFNFRRRDPEKGGYIVRKMSDFDNDLIMWNGSWIRRPGMAGGRGC